MTESAAPHDVSPWKPTKASRASQDVVEQITRAFFDGMRPGDWLGTESELASRFGVSRITLRDAVRSLEAQGIVDVKVGAGGGLRIAKGDPDRFATALSIQLQLAGITWNEITQAMRTIEPTTTSLAATHASAADLARLTHTVESARRHLDDSKAFTATALDFHLAVAEACGNRALQASVRALRSVQTEKFEPNTSREVALRVCAAHEEILDAVTRRDPESARDAMIRHLDLVAGHDRSGAM